MIKKAILLTFLSTSSFATGIDELKWVGQEYYPYSYMDEKSQKPAGIYVDIVEAIMNKADSKAYDIGIHSFNRSFIRHTNDTNVVFFPLIKTSGRAWYFKWVGPIGMDEPVVFAKRTKNIVISSPEDFEKYKIAGKDNYNANDQIDASIRTNDTNEESIKQLDLDKVDLVVCNKRTCQNIIKNKGLKLNDYRVVYNLEASELSFAFNRDTDDALVEQVRKSFAEFKNTKEYKDILNKYE
jgi:polar amino acid transport system substrate-binding protein